MAQLIELNVLSRQKGLAKQKSAFIVEWEGVERRVQMFEFQESEGNPECILCNVDEKGITQSRKTLYERFYPDKDASYTFKIKNKFKSNKFYEVIDPRIEKDGIKQRLFFSQSSPDLEVGQTVKCSIKSVTGSSLNLQLDEVCQIVMDFRTLESIFKEVIREWIGSLFNKPQFLSIKKLYEDHDGRWIILFAKEIEKIVYCILTERNDGDNFLREFCTDWLKVVEHSPFIAKMSKQQAEAYRVDFTSSIEICEDFLDALNVPERDSRVIESINSLDPGFYQFRLEKRLRFLAYTFSSDASQLEGNIIPLLEKLKVMGEEKCCEGNVPIALTHILKLYVNKVGYELENTLSRDSNGTLAIKNCAICLCYLTRIMYRCGDVELAPYTSRIYQLLSLWDIFSKEDKLTLLRNAYYSLFINKCPLESHQWGDFVELVTNRSYRFCLEIVPFDNLKQLVYSNANTEVKMSNDTFSIAPIDTLANNMSSLKLYNGLSVNLCYGKSLTRLSQEPDFVNVQSVWSTVEKSVFAPAKVIQKKEEKLLDGDEIDVYITEIIDEHKAKCRAVDYDIEGTIAFHELFFYDKANVEIDDFIGPDGSPMLFPAIYTNNNGNAKFSSQKFKVDYARESMPREAVCCVISKVNKNRIAVSEGGFFYNFKTDDESVEPLSFVELFVNRTKITGYADAEFVRFSEAKFDYSKVYRNFLVGMNDYYFEDCGTLASANSDAQDIVEQKEGDGDITVTESYIHTLANIVFRISCFEKELRQRYGCIYISKMLSELIHDEKETAMHSISLKYTKILYDFSVNNKLLDMDVEGFANELADSEYAKEAREMENVIRILGRYGKTTHKNTLDETLVGVLTTDATPLEKELARLVLISNLMTNFNNRAIEDHLLEEVGNRLNINIVMKAPVSIGLEEGQKVEFKTSIVYPPTGDGIEDIDLQSDNIAREISAMINATGGTLYIGVNDFGNVVGIESDLEYFSSGNEKKGRDNLMNHFCNLLSQKFGAKVAAKIEYDFDEVQGYTIFKITIPAMPGYGGDYIRVGTTCQRK